MTHTDHTDPIVMAYTLHRTIRRFRPVALLLSSVMLTACAVGPDYDAPPLVATGDGWSARVLPGGADFQLIVNDRLSELDARYVLETDGGDLIYVQNRAVRSGPAELIARLVRGELVDPAQVYFRCSPSFETASPALSWMAERMFVGTGARYPDSVAMRFFELR